jgi:YidC/Oxa1 family membrane protein insertase
MYTRGGASGVIARGDEKERFDADDLEGGTRFVPASANPSWIGIDGRYFAVAMVKAAGSGHASLRAVEVPQAEDGDDAEPRRIVMESGARELLLFTGPKEDRLLRRLDDSLQTRLSGLVDWGFFGFIARPLYLGIAWLHEKLGNWGFAIIVMTILIRLAFIPLTQRSMISMRKTQENMAKLQPKIRKIKEKYRDKRDMESRRKMNEETMALYQKEGVNPMSSLAGCFPLLLQLPVLYGMFRMLTVVVELRGAPFFGWIVDLSAPDPYFITPIVMGVTMFAQQLMTMAKTEDPQQRSQQRIMLFMPLMFTYFFLWAPSGLVVYWLVNNILGIGQQYFVNRHTKRAAEAAA